LSIDYCLKLTPGSDESVKTLRFVDCEAK